MSDKILFINACARKESRTRRLAQGILNSLDGEVSEIDLYAEKISPLDGDRLAERDNLLADEDYGNEMFKYARAVAEADQIVIAAPYWDLSFPSVLKIFVEAVSVSGITFYYTEEGWPVGLCKASRLIYITSSGGTIGEYDFGYEYIKTIFHDMYGVDRIEAVRLENLDVVGNDLEDMLKAAIERESKKWLESV